MLRRTSRPASYLIYSLSSHMLLKSLCFDYDVSSVSIHPGFERLVVGSASDPWVRIHEYETGRQLGTNIQSISADCSELIKGHHGPVHCVSYAPNGYLFATGSEVQQLKYSSDFLGWYREITQRDN